jgi:hypothetical protein
MYHMQICNCVTHIVNVVGSLNMLQHLGHFSVLLINLIEPSSPYATFWQQQSIKLPHRMYYIIPHRIALEMIDCLCSLDDNTIKFDKPNVE